ncbi:response regulator [Limibacillus sp. MBR-115]|jgi:PAS domain S-box-containing protein|uniref:response regulator n=1 Tax=Limibacillus sp. MBR-115 TaxID=3156465 RepID=UPI003394EA4A
MTHILIVEDSATQAAKIEMILAADGYEVEVAASAEEALEALERSVPDIVISDIVMPGISGYDLCKKIKGTAASRNVPVILLTDRKNPMDVFMGLECGADNFVTKPYDTERLLQRIKHILYNRSLQAEGKLRVGLEIAFFGKVITINSDKQQILDLLISSFEETLHLNHDLERSRNQLAEAQAKLQEYAQQLEHRVRSSEERYRAIVEGISDGVITFGEDGQIESANPAAEAMFGYQAGEIVSMSIDALVPDAPSAIGDCSDAAREMSGHRKDGTSFPLSVGYNRVTLGDKTLVIAAIKDLSEQKAVEEQLRQSQKMEAVGQLTGGIAHDFNNILTVVIGNLETLSEELKKDPMNHKLAIETLRSAEHGAELTSRLLSFSRKQPLSPSDVDINELVSSMSRLLARTLGERIKVQMGLADGPCKASIDPHLLESAVLNLCINARDAMPNGGKLTIETAETHLDEDYAQAHLEVTPGDYVMLAISDSGEGMPQDIIERAFDPFFTTKEVGKGSGLGLSMVYGFIKQSGGHIKIYSEVGHGTAIKLYLPLADNDTLSEPTPDPSMEPSIRAARQPDRPVKILVVEDDPAVRSYVESQLGRLGHQVTTCTNGEEAWNLIEAGLEFDLLLTDLVMPGEIDGHALAITLRKTRPEVPIIFTSGYTRSAVLHNGLLSHDVHFLQKPYRRKTLADKIREALEH